MKVEARLTGGGQKKKPHLKHPAALHRPLRLTECPACPHLCPFPLLLIPLVLIPPVFFFFFLTIRSFPSPRTLISGLELNSAQRPLYHPSSCVRLTSPLGCRPSSLLPSFSPHPLFPVPLGGRRNNVPGQPESPSCGPTSPHALQAGLALSPHLSEAAIL